MKATDAQQQYAQKNEAASRGHGAPAKTGDQRHRGNSSNYLQKMFSNLKLLQSHCEKKTSAETNKKTGREEPTHSASDAKEPKGFPGHQSLLRRHNLFQPGFDQEVEGGARRDKKTRERRRKNDARPPAEEQVSFHTLNI